MKPILTLLAILCATPLYADHCHVRQQIRQDHFSNLQLITLGNGHHQQQLLLLQQPAYYYSVGQSLQYESIAEKAAEKVLQKLQQSGGVPSGALGLQPDALQKCAGCHSGTNPAATEAWKYPVNWTAADVIRAGRAFRTGGMAEKVGATKDPALFKSISDAIDSHPYGD